MRKLVAHLVCLGLLATAAQAQPVIEFYFSTMSCADADPYSYTLPPEYVNGVIPYDTFMIGEEIYLWARTPYDSNSAWNNIAIDFTSDVVVGWMHDEVPSLGKGTIDRWENGSDFDPTDEGINLIRGTATGIGADWQDGYGIPEDATWSVIHYCLGSIGWGYGQMYWMSVGDGLITRDGYSDSTVYFGFDDNGNPELGGSGIFPGTTSPRFDAYIPEPVSLILLAVASLMLRRR